MKKALLASIVTAATTVVSLGADTDPSQLQSFPKNLARQHLGANLFQYSEATQKFAPTQAAAAWLDDDISSGWAMLPGKQYYLLTFPQAEMLTNFSISGRPSEGTVSIYAADEIAPPGAKSWTSLAKDVPYSSINEKVSGKSFARAAKYVLLETNLSDPGPVYSLYVYGDRPAAAYEVVSREQPISTASIFGPYANESTAFSVSGLYARSYVRPQEGQSFSDAQKAIDDNPATSVTVGGTQAASLEIRTAQPQNVSRVAMEVSPGAKGRFEFFLSNPTTPSATPAAPVASIILDGSTSRPSVDFTPSSASALQVKWTPANGTDSVTIHEVNAFGGQTLAANTVTTNAVTADPIAEGPDGQVRRVARARNGSGKDGKDYKDAKGDPEAIGALDRGPYLPGALGFPPNLTNRRAVLPPEDPVSP